jgi:hypothetical protein
MTTKGIHRIEQPNRNVEYFVFDKRLYDPEKDLDTLIEPNFIVDYVFDISTWKSSSDLTSYLAPFIDMTMLYDVEIRINERQKAKIDIMFSGSVEIKKTENGSYSVRNKLAECLEEQLV